MYGYGAGGATPGYNYNQTLAQQQAIENYLRGYAGNNTVSQSPSQTYVTTDPTGTAFGGTPSQTNYNFTAPAVTQQAPSIDMNAMMQNIQKLFAQGAGQGAASGQQQGGAQGAQQQQGGGGGGGTYGGSQGGGANNGGTYQAGGGNTGAYQAGGYGQIGTGSSYGGSIGSGNSYTGSTGGNTNGNPFGGQGHMINGNYVA